MGQNTYGGSTQISRLARINYITQTSHDLLFRNLSIQPVNLQHIHIIEPQALQTPIHCLEDVLSVQAHLVDLLSIIHALLHGLHTCSDIIDIEEDLCHNDDLGSRDVVFFKKRADDTFRLAVGVGVRDVKGVDSLIVGVLHDRECFFQGNHPRLPGGVAVRHAS